MNTVIQFVQEYWYVFATIWVIIGLLNNDKRTNSVEWILTSFANKSIEYKRKSGELLTLYRAQDYKKLALAISKVADQINAFITASQRYITKMWNKLQPDSNNPFKHYLLPLSTILFPFFLLADLIAVANTLSVTIYKSSPIYFDKYSQYLTNYNLAFVFGSIVPLIVITIILILEKRLGKSEENITADQDQGSLGNKFMKIRKSALIILCISCALVVIGLGLKRFAVVMDFKPEPLQVIDFYFNVVACILVPINTVVATILFSPDAFYGFIELILGIFELLLLIPWVLYAFLFIFVEGGVIAIDILVFAIAFIYVLCQFLISSPVSLLVNGGKSNKTIIANN